LLWMTILWPPRILIFPPGPPCVCMCARVCVDL
jgi:hypothetical protein